MNFLRNVFIVRHSARHNAISSSHDLPDSLYNSPEIFLIVNSQMAIHFANVLSPASHWRPNTHKLCLYKLMEIAYVCVYVSVSVSVSGSGSGWLV